MTRAKNVLSIFCLVILLVFIFINNAQAAEWMLYGTSDFANFYYDKTSIKKINNNIIRVWMKTIHSADGKIDAFSFLKSIGKAPKNPDILSHLITFTEYDCVNEKTRFTSMTFFDEKGNLIYSTPPGTASDWEDILPESISETLEKIVCSGGKTSKTKK